MTGCRDRIYVRGWRGLVLGKSQMQPIKRALASTALNVKHKVEAPSWAPCSGGEGQNQKRTSSSKTYEGLG